MRNFIELMQWSWKCRFILGFVLLGSRVTQQVARVALGGVATQSSLWYEDFSEGFSAGLAIDGSYGSTYGVNWSCSSTGRQDDPWWRLDLGSEHDISVIEVARRTDCCNFTIDKAEIHIGNSLENNGGNHRCAVITLTSEAVMTFICMMRGRYVIISLPGVDQILTLCEVKVYPVSKPTGANVALGGVAAESSEHPWFPSIPPSVAIDGKPYAHFHQWSCSSTGFEANPWWRVDLRGPYDIQRIEVTRRIDCCLDEINGAEIRIGNSLENNGNNNPRCAVITLSSHITMIFDCNQMSGRYVNIVIPGSNETLVLCEVRVIATTEVTGVEILTMGIATQSAEPASATAAAPMAVDENPGPDYPIQTCASVSRQDNPWWQLDLRNIYRITAVSIMSAGDCCQEELNGAEVRIGLKNDTSNQRCAIISTTEGQRIYNYHCGIMDGRFVHIVLPGLQKTLTVCDVKVYGTVLQNVALRGVAFQSSSTLENGTGASSVIDARRGVCSITMNQPGQWVTVDLLVPYNVTVIQLVYTKDCCYSEDVRVDNKSCGVSHSSSESLLTLDCGGMVGRYVTVMHPDIPPPLCEVEIYSTWEHPQNLFPQWPPSHEYCLSCINDYIAIRSEPKTWFDAQTYCREKYTDIATIKDNQDMNRAFDLMGNVNDFWIGLYEDIMTWRWSLSNGANFRNWGIGEPNNTTGVQHCAGIQHTGEWKDLDCDIPNYFLCFDGHEGAKETKILVETEMKWSSAQRYCRESYTDLLSVENEADNMEIQKLVPEGKLAWIGLFGDSWKWSDGSYSSFRYWSQQTFNSSGDGQNCALVSDWKWSVRSCNTEAMFVCSYYKKKTVVRISAAIDMGDPDIQQQILSQLDAQMKKNGISNFKISWKKIFKPQKDNDPEQCVS